jgi:hypothetical protein
MVVQQFGKERITTTPAQNKSASTSRTGLRGKMHLPRGDAL